MDPPEDAVHTRRIGLRWRDGLVFDGETAGGVAFSVDSDGVSGPSPMETLLSAVASCMAVDVRLILEKSRVPLRSLRIDAIGTRAPSIPKRFSRIHLIFHLEGPEQEHSSRVGRAIDLSRETYCSVLHSLRPDLDVAIDVVIAGVVGD